MHDAAHARSIKEHKLAVMEPTEMGMMTLTLSRLIESQLA